MNEYTVARELILASLQHEEKPTIEAMVERFESEYGWRIRQAGMQKAAMDWLQGLAIHVPFYTHEVEALGFTDGWEPGQYWHIMAQALVEIVREVRA